MNLPDPNTPFLKSKRFITLGFVLNLAIMSALVVVFILITYRMDAQADQLFNLQLAAAILIVLQLIATITVYFLLKNQNTDNDKFVKAIHLNKTIMQSILDNTSNPIYIKKINGEYEFINDSYARLFEKQTNDFIGKTDEDLFNADLSKTLWEGDLAVVKEKKEVKADIRLNPAGSPITYLAIRFPLFTVDQRIYAIAGILTDISERKELEQLLNTRDRFFRLSQNFMIVFEGTIAKQVNEKLCEALGYTEAELIGRDVIDFNEGEDQNATQSFLDDIKQSTTNKNFEKRLKTKNGKIVWVSWTGVSDPQTGLIYCVGHDITERKSQEEELKMYKNFFEHSFDGLVVANTTHFIKINPAMTRILGWTQEDYDAEPFLTFNHPDDIGIATDTVTKLIHGETMVNFRVRINCKDGSIKLLEWNATADLSKGLLYGVARDITQQNWLETERNIILNNLHENEQQLRLIVENIGDGVIVSNAEKKVVLSNYMANEILDGEFEDEHTLNLADKFELYYPDEKTQFPSQNLPMERALLGESTDDIDLILWNPKRQIKKRILLSGRPIVNEEDKIIAGVVTIKDISRYKQLEEELVEARRMIGFQKE